jgi:hypothetical protein
MCLDNEDGGTQIIQFAFQQQTAQDNSPVATALEDIQTKEDHKCG